MGNVFKVVAFTAVGIFLYQFVNWVFQIIATRKCSAHLRFLKSAVNVLVIIVTVYSLAQQFEVTKDLSTTLLQSGSLIVAVATFAAQHALANVISGFSLSFSNPYNVTDKIKVVQGSSTIAEGIVTDITLRHTIISQYNGESCIVPNSVMDSSVITNTNFTENIGNFMEIEITYDSDIEMAMEIMQKICAGHKLTLNTMENKVFVKGYSVNGIILKTTIWTKNLDDSFQACSDIRISLVHEFRKKNICIPYHMADVYIHDGEEYNMEESFKNKKEKSMQDNK